MKLRTRLFLAAFGVAGLTLVLAGFLVARSLQEQLLSRIESDLVAETQLVGELVERLDGNTSISSLDAEADTLGAQLGARVTFIAPSGQVVGDSAETGAALYAMENHRDRPEVETAANEGFAVTRRYSTTVQADLLYVALQVNHSDVSFVRLALPLTEVDEQLDSIRNATILGLLIALAGAFVLAWVSSMAMTRRVQSIAAVARRYADGDLTPEIGDYGNDEIGIVARALGASVQELGRRLSEISRNRRLTEAILSSMVEGVLVVDARGRIQMTNSAVRQLLQIDDIPIDQHYVELIRHPDIAKQVGLALEDGGSSFSEITLSTDPTKECLASVTPFRGQDETGVVLVLRDVTDYRRSEQIRQDFVANVSHELRTPLTAIRGSIDALFGDSDVSIQQYRFLDIISRHSRRMERLVADLLRLARLDAGKEELDCVPCDTRELFSDIAAEIAPMLQTKHQSVEVNINEHAKSFLADPGKIHDALKNLLENASRYAPTESVIELTAILDDGFENILLSVHDRGPGIPDTDLPRVFERFYRVEQSRARNPGGTGLGLAIVKHLVGLHAGRIEAFNRSGGGTVFTVVLPRKIESSTGASDEMNHQVGLTA